MSLIEVAHALCLTSVLIETPDTGGLYALLKVQTIPKSKTVMVRIGCCCMLFKIAFRKLLLMVCYQTSSVSILGYPKAVA